MSRKLQAMVFFRICTYGLIFTVAFSWSALFISNSNADVAGVFEIPKTLNVITEKPSATPRNNHDNAGLITVLPITFLPWQQAQAHYSPSTSLVNTVHTRPQVRAPPYLHLS
jgi:hypothetical protein